MHIRHIIKKLTIWTILAAIFLSGFWAVFISPQKTRAVGTFAGREFTGSHFLAQSGKLTHTYYFDGVQKTQAYSNETTVVMEDLISRIYFLDTNRTYKVYQMDSGATHKNTGIGTLTPTESPFYIAVRSDRDNPSKYSVVGMFFRAPCVRNTIICDPPGPLGKVFYFKALDFDSINGNDDRSVYDTNSELYGYIQYINSYPFNIQGLTGENSNPCSISGKINIDYTGQKFGTETGIQGWPSDKITSGATVRAQLWYKGPGATRYDYTGENTNVNDMGDYVFEAKERPVGSYIATVLLVRTNSTKNFSGRLADTLETAGDKIIVPDYGMLGIDYSDKEGFFGQSAPIKLEKNCSAINDVNITLKSIGIKETAEKESDCFDITAYVTKGVVGGALTNVFCQIIKIIASVGEWIIKTFGIANIINTYHPPPQRIAQEAINFFVLSSPTAHAAESAIKNDLSNVNHWSVRTWKIILGLADVFVVIVLLFLALTNILHIQYDTYAIKKSLPTLILGVILANFSILITKMLVDATNALTATFTHEDPGAMLHKLITAMVPKMAETSGLCPSNLLGSDPGLGTLFIAIFFGFFAIIVFLIIGFLFYIRYGLILVLTVVAPLAFVLMAFPPTQGIFKQWWGWYAKFIFMKPISILLIWIATQVLCLGGGQTITGWGLAVFLLIAAIIVPFKMGGAVMGAWGKAGKWLASPATGAAKRAYEGKRDAWKERANLAAERFTPLGRWRMQHDETMAGLKAERERRKDELKEQRRERLGGLEERREVRRERAKKNLEQGKQERTTAFYESVEGRAMINAEIDDAVAAGRLKQTKDDVTFDIYNRERGRELAEFEHGIANSEMRLDKRKEDNRVVIAQEGLNNYGRIPEQLRDALARNDRAEELEATAGTPAETAAAQAERLIAQGEIAAAQANLLTQVNPDTGQNYTQQEITYHRDNFVPRLQRTRNMAIVNKRNYEDAKDDSESNSPEAIANAILSATGSSMGPNSWTLQDSQNFAQGRRTSSARATSGLATKFASLRLKLQNNDTKGVALQQTARIFNQLNQPLTDTAFQRVVARMDAASLAEVQAFFQQQGQAFDAQGMQNLTLNMQQRSHNGFATAFINELGLADTDAAYDDLPTGGRNTGLGRNIASYIERS